MTHYFLAGQFHFGGRQHAGCVHDQDSEQHLRRGLCQCASGQGVSRPVLTEGQAMIRVVIESFTGYILYMAIYLFYTVISKL